MWFKQKYCLDCDKPLGNHAQYYGTIRCKSCAVKFLFKNPKNHPRFITGETLKKHYCSCGEEITYTTSFHGKGFCASCAMKQRVFTKEWRENISKVTKGKNNPNFKNWISKEPYSIEWNINLKNVIRKRDNYECQNCSMTEEEHLIVLGTVLHIHHIDYNKKNCKEDNLISLCQSCNSRANFNRSYWKEIYINKIKEIILWKKF